MDLVNGDVVCVDLIYLHIDYEDLGFTDHRSCVDLVYGDLDLVYEHTSSLH